MLIGGVDIGGTKMAAIVAGPEGPLARAMQPTVKSGSVRAVPEQAIALLDEACRKAGIERSMLKRIGVSSAGPFVTEDGMVSLVTPNLSGGLEKGANLPNDWVAIPLERVLREQFNEIVTCNDCVAALIAERSFGAVQDEKNCVYVTWSTGVGFGLCVDGHVLNGKHGNAGHAGHMLLSESSPTVCGCGNRGDVESLISGRNIERVHGRASAEIFKAAREGDTEALKIATEAARWFGKALYNLAVTLDTRVFVIGGSVWQHHGEWMLPTVAKEISSRLPALTEEVVLLHAALGGLVADIGGLCLVMPEEWKEPWRRTAPWSNLA